MVARGFGEWRKILDFPKLATFTVKGRTHQALVNTKRDDLLQITQKRNARPTLHPRDLKHLMDKSFSFLEVELKDFWRGWT